MAAFDEICGCCFETSEGVCVCVRRKQQARSSCKSCLNGRHSLVPLAKPSKSKADKLVGSSSCANADASDRPRYDRPATIL